MSESTTTSIRLSRRMREHLERRARATGKGKNWIINEALRHYLAVDCDPETVAEARRQSLLASASDVLEEEDWTDAADLEQWRNQ